MLVCAISYQQGNITVVTGDKLCMSKFEDGFCFVDLTRRLLEGAKMMKATLPVTRETRFSVAQCRLLARYKGIFE